MAGKEAIHFWFAEDQNDPVLLAIVRANRVIEIERRGARESMRAFCIGLLRAKHVWEDGVSKGIPEEDLISSHVIEAARSSRGKPRKDFVNILAALYLKRTKEQWPKWYEKLRLKAPDPLHAKTTDTKGTTLGIMFGGCWSGCDFRFFRVNRESQKPVPIDNWLKFAAELESSCGSWKTKHLARYLGTGTSDEESSSQSPSSQAAQHPAKKTLEFYQEQFNEHLNKALRDIEEGPWWKLFLDKGNPNNKLAQLGERIGELQNAKASGNSPKRKEQLPGEAAFVLEATHAVLFSANRDFPEIARAFDSLIDALEVIDHAYADLSAQNLKISRDAWMREVGRKIPPHRVYLFLLYFIYLMVEAPRGRKAQRSRELLKKNAFFSLMGGHVAGLNHAFFRFIGEEFFGEAFHNLYHRPYEIQAGDSLQSIIHGEYQRGYVDFALCLQGLVEAHEFLKGISPTAELLPILKPLEKTTIWLVPPGPKNNAYNTGINETGEWIKKRNTPPEDNAAK